MMRTLIRRTFMSWAQAGEDVRAVAICECHWFMEAINCMRDGDMGEKGEDGVYDRVWWSDAVNLGPDCDYDYRPASPAEVTQYLNHCSVLWNPDEEVVAIVRGDNESYVLYEKKVE